MYITETRARRSEGLNQMMRKTRGVWTEGLEVRKKCKWLHMNSETFGRGTDSEKYLRNLMGLVSGYWQLVTSQFPIFVSEDNLDFLLLFMGHTRTPPLKIYINSPSNMVIYFHNNP